MAPRASADVDLQPASLMIHVEMSQLDIARGLQCRLGDCPIALAIRRALPACRAVSIIGPSAWIDHTEYRMPWNAQEFVSRFDGPTTVEEARRRVHPIFFVLTQV